MQHRSLVPARVSFRSLLVSACSLLVVSGFVLSLPQPGAAQSDMSMGGSAYPADSGIDPNGDTTNADPNSPNGSPNDPNADPNMTDANTADNGNGGDSAIGPDGGAAPDPSVGVDTLGRTDAVATRNGRTTRRQQPAPANPLVITDPTRTPNTNSSGTAVPYNSSPNPNDPYSPYARAASPSSNANRLIPPIQTRPPGNYTLQTDPGSLGPRRFQTSLPLFGYDFFQPARQIIVARRRALLPLVPRTSRYNGNYNGNYNNTRSTRRSQTNPLAPNGSGYPGGSNDNSANNNADAALGAAGTRRGVPNTNQNSNYPAGSLPDPAAYGPSYNPNYNPNYGPNYPDSQAQNDPGGAYNNTNNTSNNNNNGSDYPMSGSPTPSRRGMMYGAPASDTGDYDNSGYNNSGYDNGTDGGLTGDVTSGPARRRQTRNSTNSSGYDANSYEINSPDALNSGYPGDGFPSDGFPSDAGTPMGSDIQFPGDDALVQSGTANAVTGQIADPVSTLYRNVLASLPPNYQLQPGDVLTVRYSALAIAPREFTTTVDVQGGIDVEGVGRISVTGRTATQAETSLRQRLERLYRNVDVSINLRQLRTIQVTVSGAAFAPGTYTVPATATAFNVLNAAGGPTANGSLREIRVLRGGQLAGKLDIYPLIGAVSARPSAKNGDIALQSGDNIYVPARLSRVTIRGEVRQQAVYELTTAETLRDALSYAGGVKPSGVDQNVHIDTVNNGVGRVLVDVNLRDKPKVAATSLFDGDTVQVSSVRAILTNRVTVAGAVDQPGDYALTPGMRVTDLIQRARGPLYNAYLDRADLTRLNPDNTTTLQSLSIAKALDGDPAQNVVLKRFDRIRLYSRQEVAYLGRRLVTVRGAVQRPGLYTQSDNMKVSDLLLGSGGPLPDAYLNRAVLLHQRGDGGYAYDYINLRDALGGDASQDLPVQDNDVLAVYKIGEAHFTPDHTVKVLGNVVAPGLYARGDGMRLSDLLKLSGAFKPGGGTRVTLAHARRPDSEEILQIAPVTVEYTAQQVASAGTDLTLQDGDIVAVQGDGNIKDHPSVVTVTGQVNRPGPIVIKQGTRLSDAIKEAGGLRAEAFPEGAEFTRMSDALVTTGQLNLADVINQMSNLLNLSQYQRERAKANLALIEAAGSAASGAGSSGLAIPGLGGAAPSNAANPNLAPLIATLPQNNPVSPGRLLTPSQLQPNGGVAVRLADALKRPGGTEDVLLKDGDTLVIPETPTTVQVVGAVFNARGVLYRPGQSIDYYIQRAGDFTPDAARDRIEVIHAGGGLIPASKAGALQPGDLILVPTKVLAEKVGRSGNGFSDFFQGLVGSAITLKVLSSVFGF